jgi:hypothetical protein
MVATAMVQVAMSIDNHVDGSEIEADLVKVRGNHALGIGRATSVQQHPAEGSVEEI